MNVELKEGFKQVCVWPGTLVGAEQAKEFEEFFLNELGVQVQYLEEIRTAPDFRYGYPVEGTGDRNDVFFAVHSDDLMKFAVPRMTMGIRWLEDVYGNGHGNLYPARAVDYMCWDGYAEKFSVDKQAA